ncbi:hypothetical protein [Prosthecobacter sp.]|uniref:hypothetical protein n=1 Tax=Prosthecobacter sp. TaxID=1965333 RepID=UPI002ABAF15E|nr:hypothetical protein [Prosthecobacter sp.]MDZ4403059.1 hypothetical protein [Prosthecobacter sp.]
MDEPNRQPKFELAQARELAEALAQHGADYLFLGKAGAILLGYPGTTLDLDLFAPKDADNARRCIAALRELGFHLDEETEKALLTGKDFVQIKDGPFDVDIIHAPDGIESFSAAKSRRVMEDIFPIANLRDIIASKKASNRRKDLVDMELLEEFAREYAAMNAKPLSSAFDQAMKRSGSDA